MYQIYLFTALYPEAKPLINRLSLKQISNRGSLRQYTDEKEEILLTVMGSGPVAAAFAVGSVLGTNDECGSTSENRLSGRNENLDGNIRHAILFGSAAFEGRKQFTEGNLFLGVKLRNMDSGRSFYPDPVGRSLCIPAEIQTGSRVWSGIKPWNEIPDNNKSLEASARSARDTTESTSLQKCKIAELPVQLPVLHDMEAAAFYDAASHVLGPDQIHILKFCSDKGTDAERFTPDLLKRESGKYAESVFSYVQFLLGKNGKRNLSHTSMGERKKSYHQKFSSRQSFIEGNYVKGTGFQTKDDFERDNISSADDITAEDLHASVTMENELRQLKQYGRLIGFSFAGEKQKLLQEDLLPVRDKRAGRLVLDRIRKDLLNDSEPIAHDDTWQRAANPLNHLPEKNTKENRQVIYVEEGILRNQKTLEILSHFKNPLVISIGHYKDVFNRRRQNSILQHGSHTLILAEKKGQLIYPGAPVCQSFGNAHFYYTSCVMNCMYDCEYCYLHGMYPSGIPVIFINIEDIFHELEELLQQNPVYISVSYDTDLMALENFTGDIKQWIDFTAAHPNLMIEIRTKCGRTDLFSKYKPCKRVIFAYTISPESVVQKYEHQTGSLKDRLQAAQYAMDLGFTVRLCFDPMICVPDWRKIYKKMLEQVRDTVDLSRILDASVGSFRISGTYLKPMRKMLPNSAVVQYPFELTKGYYHYPDSIEREMEGFLVEELKRDLPEERIFLWREKI